MEAKQQKNKSFRKWLTSGWTVTGLLLLALVLFVVTGYKVTARATEDGGEGGEPEVTESIVGQTGAIEVQDWANGEQQLVIAAGAPANDGIHLVTYEIYDDGNLIGTLEWRAGSGISSKAWAAPVGEEPMLLSDTGYYEELNPKIFVGKWCVNPDIPNDMYDGPFPVEDDFSTYTYKVISDVKLENKIGQVTNAWWDESRPMGVLQWEPVEGASGYYVSLGGAADAGLVVVGADNTEWILSENIVDSGTYTISIQTTGGKDTIDSDMAENLLDYEYTRPEQELPQPDKLWWTAVEEDLIYPENAGRPLVANWTPVPGAKAYKLNVKAYDAETGEYRDYFGTGLIEAFDFSGNPITEYNLESHINIMELNLPEGTTYTYKFAVQVVSGDIEAWPNTKYTEETAEFLEEFKTQTDIEEEIQNEISGDKSGNWNGFFAWLLETLGKVADAMQNSMEVLTEIITQENTYKSETSVTVEEPVVDETSGITGVEIAGAALNAEEGSLQFEIGKADESEKKHLDRKMYKGGIQLDIGLTNTVNEEEQEIKELKAPIAITMDAPEDIPTERLVVLHYREDDTVERIFPKVKKDGNKDKITFAVTGFSPYVVTSIVPYEMDGTTMVELDEEPGENPGSTRKPLTVEDINWESFVMIKEGVPEDGYLHVVTYKIYDKDGNSIGILEWRSGTPVFNGESMACWMGPEEGETELCTAVSYCRLEMNVPEAAFNTAFPGVNASECTYEIIKNETITEQVGEVTNIYWDESRRLTACWDPVEGADSYRVWFYYEGEQIDSWSGQETEVSLLTSHLSRSIFESGTYTIRVQALGGKYTLHSNMSEAVLNYEYERPETELYAPDKMWWTKPGQYDIVENENNRERPVVANWTRVPGANGYYIAIYACDVNAEEKEWKMRRSGWGGTDWASDELVLSTNLESFINSLDTEAAFEGKEYIYKFSVQVVSADFETWANTDYSKISPMMSGEFKLQTEIEADIKNQIAASNSENILDVIKDDITAVADAMQNNADVLDVIKTQEETYMDRNSVTVADPVVEPGSGITGVTIAGAGLNATEGSLQFVIGKTDATDKKRLDYKAYQGGIQLELGLTNTVGDTKTEIAELKAPIAITMDAPQGIPTELLIILHYLADGKVERIFPKVSEDGKITFAATGFSPYVLTSVVPYNASGEPVDVNGNRVGELEVPVEEKLDALELTHSFDARSNLDVNFGIDLNALNEALGTSLNASALKLLIEKENYDGNEKTAPQEDELSSGDGSSFSYWGLTPWMLGDEIRATLVVNVDGEEYARQPEVICLKDDLMAMLSDEATRTLAVDLLNYGAEAQKYFEYRTDVLVNAELTEEQQAYATTLTVPGEEEIAIDVTTLKEGKKVAGIAVNVKHGRATQLVIAPIAAGSENLGGGIQVEFFIPVMSNVFCTGAVENEDDVSGYRYAAAEGLNAQFLGFDLAITVKEEGTVISDTYTFSITDYLWRRYLQDGNDKNLVEALLKYAASAAGN